MLGLELGADDYITKPFSVREFRSRVKAVLRRAAARAARSTWRSRSRRATCVIDFERRGGRGPRRGAAHVRGVRDPGRARPRTRPRVQPHGAARARVGRLRLPRPAHGRRPHPPPAREARARPRGTRADLHRSRGGLPLPRRDEPRSGRSGTSSRSSSSRSPRSRSRRSSSSWCRSSSRTSRSAASSTTSSARRGGSPRSSRRADGDVPAPQVDRRVRAAADSDGRPRHAAERPALPGPQRPRPRFSRSPTRASARDYPAQRRLPAGGCAPGSCRPVRDVGGEEIGQVAAAAPDYAASRRAGSCSTRATSRT